MARLGAVLPKEKRIEQGEEQQGYHGFAWKPNHSAVRAR
jgi:hypothetical protein